MVTRLGLQPEVLDMKYVILNIIISAILLVGGSLSKNYWMLGAGIAIIIGTIIALLFFK